MVAHSATTLYTSHMAKRTRTTMNISLPAAQKRYVEKLVSSGDYQSTSEVVRESVRLLRERKEKLRTLTEMIDVGLRDIEAGRVVPADEVMAEWRRRDAAAIKRLASRRKSA